MRHLLKQEAKKTNSHSQRQLVSLKKHGSKRRLETEKILEKSKEFLATFGESSTQLAQT